MNKHIKTSEVLTAYNILNSAKYGSMEDVDKIKVWKITRMLKPIAIEFEEAAKDIVNKMKPDINGDFDETLQKAQEYERAINNNADLKDLPMTSTEYNKFIAAFKNYTNLVNKTIDEFANKTIDIDIEPISEDAFSKFIAGNEWTMGQTVSVSEIICA